MSESRQALTVGMWLVYGGHPVRAESEEERKGTSYRSIHHAVPSNANTFTDVDACFSEQW